MHGDHLLGLTGLGVRYFYTLKDPRDRTWSRSIEVEGRRYTRVLSSTRDGGWRNRDRFYEISERSRKATAAKIPARQIFRRIGPWTSPFLMKIFPGTNRSCSFFNFRNKQFILVCTERWFFGTWEAWPINRPVAFSAKSRKQNSEHSWNLNNPSTSEKIY